MLKPLQSVFASAAVAVGLTISGAAYADDPSQAKKADVTATAEQPQQEGKKFVPFIQSTILTDGKVKANTEDASILNMKDYIGKGKTEAAATPTNKPAANEPANTPDTTIIVAP